MKILFVQKMNAVSGSELYLMHMLPELKRRGYEVQILVIFPIVPDKIKPFIDHANKNEIVIHEIYGHTALSPILVHKIKKLLKKEKFDIVQSNLVHADLWMAIQKALFFNKMKLISVKHGFDEAYSAKYGNDPSHLKKSLFYWVQRMSSLFTNFNVTVSMGLYNMYVQGKIVSVKKIKNIYYGLDLKEKEIFTTQNEPEEKYAIILGRLIKYKGHEYLLKAWQKVKVDNNNWQLYIIGSGKYENELQNMAKQLNLLDSVKFLGHQSNPHPFIKNSIFTIVTSKWEGFGLIMLESWMHKKPIIAFDAPAMNEVIKNEETGLLAKQENIDELAEKITYYFKNPETAIRHGIEGYKKLNSYYTVPRMADEMCEVYERVYDKSN